MYIFLAGALTASVLLSGCHIMSKTEISVLHDAAKEHAKTASLSTQLSYTKCYPLLGDDKRSCRRELRKTDPNLNNADSWAYIQPFETEATRQGFAAFIRMKGGICPSIADNPMPLTEGSDIYHVVCSSTREIPATHHKLRYDWYAREWFYHEAS